MSISSDQVQGALDALGFKRNPLEATQHTLAFLIGSLLAVAETLAWEDIDRPDLPQVQDGYMSVLALLSGFDEAATARGWMVILNDRLNRTAVELREAVDGEGRVFSDVAGPAMLVASNMMYVLNHSAIDQEMVRSTVATAEGNLAAATKALATLKTTMRGFGFQVD